MLEEIIMYLKQHPSGVSSSELAKKFLKIQNAQSSFAHLTISSILSKNKKCYLDAQGNWHVQLTSSSSTPLNQLPLTGIFILGDTGKKDRQIYYVALWKIFPEPQYLCGGWTMDRENLQKANLLEFTSMHDPAFDPSRSPDLALYTANQLKSTIPVFFSSFEQNLLRSAVVSSGIELTDDTIHLYELLKAASIEVPDPKSLFSCYSTLFEKTSEQISAFKQGQLFADSIREVIRILLEKGIDSREEIDMVLKEIRSPSICGKAFSYEDICSLPAYPGVFGLKDISGKYLYIGKSDNLKRKMLGYLRNPEENPVKLKLLLQNSHSLITHQCASELEALLYEYRLIMKHSPELNLRIDDNQTDGLNSSLDDCIILLPHTQKDSVMTFWSRKNFRIKIKVLDFKSNDTFIAELEEYFLPKRETREAPDQLEMSLVCRWIKKNQDQSIIIPINRPFSGSEVLSSIIFFWNNRLINVENRNTP